MAFEFINNAVLDRRTRKLIRSHAAKGRNVGKKHPSRGRRAAIKANITESIYKPKNKALEPHHQLVLPTIERQVGDTLSVFSLPVESTPGSRVIIQKVVQAFAFLVSIPRMPGLGKVIDFSAAGSIWIQFWFVDEASSIAAKTMLTSSSEDSSEGLRHLSDSLRLVNQRLSGGGALSDTTIASVVAMLQYERSPTHFSIEELPDTATIDWLCKGFRASRMATFLESQVFAQLQPSMQDAWVDVMSLTWFLNESENDNIKMDGDRYHDTLTLIGYRLVYVRPLNKGRCGTLENNFLICLFSAIGSKRLF
ncbi:hypothetical protein Daesc_005444 [Daldinia eschscholtzii]|uniref:Uncharacterized protein n=1 Tax=Daldinia eschscholtzii TaxID=292717 RepID=A0AAX6MKY5_9PEZI